MDQHGFSLKKDGVLLKTRENPLHPGYLRRVPTPNAMILSFDETTVHNSPTAGHPAPIPTKMGTQIPADASQRRLPQMIFTDFFFLSASICLYQRLSAFSIFIAASRSVTLPSPQHEPVSGYRLCLGPGRPCIRPGPAPSRLALGDGRQHMIFSVPATPATSSPKRACPCWPNFPSNQLWPRPRTRAPWNNSASPRPRPWPNPSIVALEKESQVQ